MVLIVFVSFVRANHSDFFLVQSLGGFTSIEDLSLAPGVGTNLIEVNRQILTMSAPIQSSQTSVATRKANTRNRYFRKF